MQGTKRARYLCDPASKLRLGRREKRRAKITNGLGKTIHMPRRVKSFLWCHRVTVALFGEKAVYGACVGGSLVAVLRGLALARRVYQTDHVVGRTRLCYSYHKLLRVPRRCFRCAFLSLFVVFRLVMFLCCFVLSHLSHGRRTTPIYY